MSDRYYPTSDEEIKSLFMEYYLEFQNCFYDSDIVFSDIKTEIVPLMYVVSDIASISANCNRKFISDIFIAWYKKSLTTRKQIDAIFDNRVELYGEFIRGKKPRYDWLFSKNAQNEDNGFFRCCAALGDILINPNCAESYDNAPVYVHNLTDVVKFAQKMNGFYSVVVEFYNALYKKYLSILEENKHNAHEKADANTSIPPVSKPPIKTANTTLQQETNYVLFICFLRSLSLTLPLIMINAPIWVIALISLLLFLPLLTRSLTFFSIIEIIYNLLLRPGLYIVGTIGAVLGNQDFIAIVFYIITALQLFSIFRNFIFCFTTLFRNR